MRDLIRFIRAGVRAVRTRRALIDLDDRLRADIGISRGDALVESERKFWDLETLPDPTRRSRGG